MGDKKTLTRTAQEVYDILGKIIADGHGSEEFKVSIPYQDNIGLHYEGFINITTHSGIVDMYVTKPIHDDVEKKK